MQSTRQPVVDATFVVYRGTPAMNLALLIVTASVSFAAAAAQRHDDVTDDVEHHGMSDVAFNLY